MNDETKQPELSGMGEGAGTSIMKRWPETYPFSPYIIGNSLLPVAVCLIPGKKVPISGQNKDVLMDLQCEV